MNVRGLGGLLVLVLCLTTTPPSLAQQTDIDAIRELQQQQAEAWNRHDAAAYARLFTDDGDVVVEEPGRDQEQAGRCLCIRISGQHVDDYRRAGSLPSTGDRCRSRFVDAGRSQVTAWRLGSPRSGIQLQVLTKQSGRWLIASFQNTNSVPETPFPKASGGPKP